MTTLSFVLAALLIGLATGKLAGAGLAFTHGRTRDDLVAGLLGSLVVAVPLHLIGPAGYREPLPALLVGLSAALLATWLRRIMTWKQEPLRPLTEDSAEVSQEVFRHDMLTTAEGTGLLLSGGRLVLAERQVVRPAPGALR
jgi:hypothetical protein